MFELWIQDLCHTSGRAIYDHNELTDIMYLNCANVPLSLVIRYWT